MTQLSELKVFVTAAEELSFTRAAERLHLSQAAVSQNIQALERQFGVELFIRRGRTLRLSEAGQALLPLAREVLNAARRLGKAMSEIEGEVAGELFVGCSTTSGKYLLPSLVAAFRREYPLVRVGVKVLTRDDVLSRLLDGRLALGVVSHRPDQLDLEYMPLFEDRVILIVAPEHPWAAYGRALPADLVDEPIIMREERAGTTQVVQEGLARHNISPDMLNIVLEIGNAEAIEMAVEEGIGIAFVSELAAARGLALGRVKQVEVVGLDLRRTIFMARSTREPLTRTQERFWEFVQSRRQLLAERITQTTQLLTGRPA
jgi:DNA-binding transcriptional LysR family regulator